MTISKSNMTSSKCLALLKSVQETLMDAKCPIINVEHELEAATDRCLTKINRNLLSSLHHPHHTISGTRNSDTHHDHNVSAIQKVTLMLAVHLLVSYTCCTAKAAAPSTLLCACYKSLTRVVQTKRFAHCFWFPRLFQPGTLCLPSQHFGCLHAQVTDLCFRQPQHTQLADLHFQTQVPDLSFQLSEHTHVTKHISLFSSQASTNSGQAASLWAHLHSSGGPGA